MESTEPPPSTWYFALLIVLLLCSMFFSASEISFLSASKLHIRYLKEKKNSAAIRVERLLRKKEKFLNTVLIGNNTVNIITSALITSLAVSAFKSAGVGIATASATIIILIFGEILPKSAALHWPEPIALRVSLPISIMMILLSPLVLLFTTATRLLAALFGIRFAPGSSSVTEDDLKTLIEVGEEEGLIEKGERVMMHKIFRYTDLTARDIMTPRIRIASISLSATLQEVLELSHTSRFSRFPVYEEDIDDIKGILYIKDILFARNLYDDTFSLKQLIRPALYIFEGRKISAVQSQLRNANQNMAVIVDEYGGTDGIVTTEDLIEEIFGSIRDEFDAEDKPVKAPVPNVFTFEGSARLEEVSEHLGIFLESNFYDTIGGYIMEKTDDIPMEGVTHTEQGFRFHIDTVSGKRITGVTITRTGGEQS